MWRTGDSDRHRLESRSGTGSPKKTGRRHSLAYSSGIQMMAAYISSPTRSRATTGVLPFLELTTASIMCRGAVMVYKVVHMPCSACLYVLSFHRHVWYRLLSQDRKIDRCSRRDGPVPFYQRCCPVRGSHSRGHRGVLFFFRWFPH